MSGQTAERLTQLQPAEVKEAQMQTTSQGPCKSAATMKRPKRNKEEQGGRQPQEVIEEHGERMIHWNRMRRRWPMPVKELLYEAGKDWMLYILEG